MENRLRNLQMSLDTAREIHKEFEKNKPLINTSDVFLDYIIKNNFTKEELEGDSFLNEIMEIAKKTITEDAKRIEDFVWRKEKLQKHFNGIYPVIDGPQNHPSVEHIGPNLTLEEARMIYQNINPLGSRSTGEAMMVVFLHKYYNQSELESKKGFTWEDSFDKRGYVMGGMRVIDANDDNISLFKTKKQALSAIAFAQLTHIVPKYNKGKPVDPNKLWTIIYSPKHQALDIELVDSRETIPLLEFFDRDDAITSLEVNRDLWEQYWMIEKNLNT